MGIPVVEDNGAALRDKAASGRHREQASTITPCGGPVNAVRSRFFLKRNNEDIHSEVTRKNLHYARVLAGAPHRGMKHSTESAIIIVNRREQDIVDCLRVEGRQLITTKPGNP